MSFKRAPNRFSAVPLTALTAVVLDTETTGLDTARDRVVEIGAVRLHDGGDESAFSSLVSPGIPISAASTAIHHITDQDVAGAPVFPDVMAALVEWIGEAVLIGFSFGFDLAVLQAEHQRHGLVWQAPRSLDVRHAMQLVAPDLPELSLEIVADWLGIEITDRHRALGDARLTASVFSALVPKLRDRGIVTLAQLERAGRALATRVDDESRAGWHPVGEAPPHSVAEYARIDSFPYRHRAAELMHSPPIVIDAATPLRAALSQMVDARVSSLFLAPDRASEAPGIITERDVLRAVEAEGAAALDQPVSAFGQRPLVTINADEFAYRALTGMANRGFRHLGVVDDTGALVGALSARDLLRQRADAAISLGDSIEAATSAIELGRVWSELTAVARALDHEEVDVRDIAAIISRELRALTRRACELAENAMAADGLGPAPVPFALLVLGSGGRGESLLAMDQDNAIVHADPPVNAEVDAWFAELGKRLSDTLNTAGVAYCKGGVMASNAAWRHSLTGWRDLVGGWLTRSTPQDILNCDIFFDAVAVNGETGLADTLLAEARTAAAGSGNFLKLLALNAAEFRRPRGLFGRLKLSEGRTDLKAGGIMPIFSAARVAALRHSIAERATPARLRAAADKGVATPRAIDNLIEAHAILLGLVLRQQLADIDEGLALGNKVAVGALSGIERDQLAWALDQLPAVADVVGVPAS